MWIFGKKANQQSTTDVPPELQQYYGRSGIGARLRQVSLFALPALAFIAVLAAVIGGAIWLRHHSLADIFGRRNNKPATSQQANQQSSQQPQSAANNNSSVSQQGQQSVQAGSDSQQTATTDNTEASNSAPGGKPTTDNGSQQTGVMPNTGPGETTFAIAGATAVIAAAAFHTRQLRRATKS